MRLLTLITFLLFPLFGGDYSVITAKDNTLDGLNRLQLRDIFLQKRQFVKEQRIIAVNLLADNDVRKAFELNVLKMQRKKLNSYWIKQHFHGISPPTTLASFEAVKRFVGKVEGAIGYIPSNMVDNSVKVLYEF